MVQSSQGTRHNRDVCSRLACKWDSTIDVQRKTCSSYHVSGMGTTLSKEEALYHEVLNGNHDAVTALCQEGASLEWTDKQGRTPLLLACSRVELYSMAITLLSLGANIKAYRAGEHGGFPLHYASKRGLHKTVALLLSNGGNPLDLNDDGQTALDLARSRGHVSIVRMIEEKISLFSEMLREVSGLSILESFAPQLVTNKVWVVVLPSALSPRRFEIAIYDSPKVNLWSGVRISSNHPAGLCNVSQPKTVLLTNKAEIGEPNFGFCDPVLHITDTTNWTKYKFLSENKGDNVQLERFYQACRGIRQNSAVQPRRKSSHRPAQDGLMIEHPTSSLSNQTELSIERRAYGYETLPEDLVLALALDESIRTARDEGISVSPTTLCQSTLGDCRGWPLRGGGNNRPGIPKSQCKTVKRLLEEDRVPVDGSANVESSRPRNDTADICHVADSAFPKKPAVFSTKGQGNNTSAATENASTTAGMCVICWDAPSEGACIPCGHLAGCMHCLTEIKSQTSGCPVCRCEIERVIKVYAV